MDTPEVGKVYHVHDQGKGAFVIRVDHVDPTWVTGRLVDGEAASTAGPNRRAGDPVSLRRAVCKFSPMRTKGD